MRANLRPLLAPLVVGEERVRRQLRHVAIDTPADERAPALRIETTTLWRMAAEAAPRKRNDITLRLMDVVAGGAGHLRRAEARTPLQQRNLEPLLERASAVCYVSNTIALSPSIEVALG